MKSITSKTGLIRSLKAYYLQQPSAVAARYSVFDSIATSYILEVGSENDEYWAFVQRYKELSQGVHLKERMPGKHCEHNLWLMKPANANQGRGISVVRSLRELKRSLSSKLQHSLWVIQKYIERPMLYNGRKFDIRVWALVLDTGDLFLYRDGYVRTSSEKFSLASKANFVHLTNNCLQVCGNNYGKHEEGNTLSFDAFRLYLENAYSHCKEKVSFNEHIMPRIKDLIIDTVMAVKGVAAPAKRGGCCFELLGYDFMIDEDLRVWLIEVNINPYLGMPNEYIKKLLPRMASEMLDIALDSAYPCHKSRDEDSFELLYSEGNSQFSTAAVNKRRGFGRDLVYPLQELAVARQPAPAVLKVNAQKPEASGNSVDLGRYLAKAKPAIPPVKVPASTDESLSRLRSPELVIAKQSRITIRKRSVISMGLEDLANNIIKWKNYTGFAVLLDRMTFAVKKIVKEGNVYMEKSVLNVNCSNRIGVECSSRVSGVVHTCS